MWEEFYVTVIKIQLDEFVADFKRQSALIRQRLKATEAAIQQDERRRASEGAEMRIRKTQHSQMTRRFLDVISDFNNSQLKFREMCKGKLLVTFLLNSYIEEPAV